MPPPRSGTRLTGEGFERRHSPPGPSRRLLLGALIAALGCVLIWRLPSRGEDTHSPLEAVVAHAPAVSATPESGPQQPLDVLGTAHETASDPVARSAPPATPGAEDDADAVDGSADDDWSSFPREGRSVARLFAKVPTGVVSSMLVRNPTLNPADQRIPAWRIALLDELLRIYQGRIKDVLASHSKLQHEKLLTLLDAGHLFEVTPQTVPAAIWQEAEATAQVQVDAIRSTTPTMPSSGTDTDTHLQTQSREQLVRMMTMSNLRARMQDIVPGAVSWLMHHGRLFIGTRDQMTGFEGHGARMGFLQEAFLREVLTWFLEQGLMSSKAAADEVEEFRRIMGS